MPAGWAGSNYVFNYGSDFLWQQAATNGIFAFNDKGLEIGDITDGTSNTACFTERLKGDFSNAISTDRTDLFSDEQHQLNQAGQN